MEGRKKKKNRFETVLCDLFYVALITRQTYTKARGKGALIDYGEKFKEIDKLLSYQKVIY